MLGPPDHLRISPVCRNFRFFATKPRAIERLDRMEYVTLGRTEMRVSVAGLGCGGFSRLGLGTGKSEAEAVSLVREAMDMGINLLDTAAVYGTEGIIGEALKN